jgi:HemY protein
VRALFWVIALFALAVGLVVAARYNAGYVLVVLPPYRAEISFNLLLILLFIGFLAGYLLVRVVSGTLTLPARVREYRVARRRERAKATLLEALQEFFAGRYAKAEKTAADLIATGEHAGLCAILAARAAHGLRAFERRDAYLAQAAAMKQEDDTARVVTEAELLLEQRRFQDALAVLKSLPRKHTAALRLELKAQQFAKNWEQVLVLIEQLEKRGVFDAEQAAQLRHFALAEDLRRKALDTHALEEAWQKVPAPDRRDTKLAATAARCFIALGGCAQARQIIESSLEENWDSELAVLYAECPAAETVKQIERAEGWLRRHSDDPALLLALGRLCAQQDLWGKAQSYLEASLSIEPSCSAHLALAQLHERMGNNEAARKHYRESLELAVTQLKQISGGRRRTSL